MDTYLLSTKRFITYLVLTSIPRPVLHILTERP